MSSSIQGAAMRIVYFHRGYFPSLAGAETMARCVAATLQQRGHEVKIVCQSSGESFQHERHNDVEVLGVPTLDPAALRSHLDPQPDIIHAVDAVWPEFPQAAQALARGWHVPFMITPASTISTWHDVSATLDVCRAADAVFVLTEAERTLFRQHAIAADRLVVIGQAPYLVGTPDPEGFRGKYGITGPMVLFLGRKVHFKGYRLLLSATAEVWSRCPDAYFVFIGPRWDQDCLDVFKAFADRRISEIDTVDEFDKHSALAACDLVCLPSSADVFPLVYVEAWACGKPVIAAPFPGIEEIVRHEQDGLIVEATPSAIAAAIVCLLGDAEQRQTMGTLGRLRVSRQFNWEAVTDRIEATYNRCIVPKQ